MGFIEPRQEYRCKATGEISRNFLKVLPEIVTPGRDYARRDRGKYIESETVFREIEIVPPEEIITEEIKELFSLEAGTILMDESHFFAQLRERLLKVIEENWKPEKDHIVMHSSGRDSRMLSWLIRKLFHKHGPDWLGNIIFLCSKQEGPPFKQIMEYEGWKKDQYLVVGENLKDEDIFAPIFLNFKNAWRMCNGSFTDARNMFIYFPEVAHRERNFPLENIQTWSGYFSDEFAEGSYLETGIANLNPGGPAIKHMFEHLYWIPTYSSRPMMGEVIFPFADIDYVRLIVQSSIRLGPQKVRNHLLASMDPELTEFHNSNVSGHRYPEINDQTLSKARKDYQKSWFGRKKQRYPEWGEVPGRYEPMLSYWTTASLIEHLTTTGYTVK